MPQQSKVSSTQEPAKSANNTVEKLLKLPKTYNKFITHYKKEGYSIVHQDVSFMPAVTINCSPPYIEGKRDSCYVSYRQGNKPKTKRQWETLIGMEVKGFY
jgi:hypothetical protein